MPTALSEMVTVEDYLEAQIDQGLLSEDPVQRQCAQKLDHLNRLLAQVKLANKSSALGWLFAKKKAARQAVKGLYIWGGVGRGKTMLMDLFYKTSPLRKKKRVHFHDFMRDVHAQIHLYRQDEANKNKKDFDPVPPIARKIADDVQLLCFDEFLVTDITDAMLLGRLFAQLFSLGVVLVATSNIPPEALYKDGLNRALFLPFIDLLQNHVDVFHLLSETDYRMQKISELQCWRSPLGLFASHALDKAWLDMSGVAKGKQKFFTVKGRSLEIAQSYQGFGRSSFDALCCQPLGAEDYAQFADYYHTFFLDDIPKLKLEQRNEAKRFITLIDLFYEAKTCLFASADCDVDKLYEAPSGYEAFAFDRTISRLIEMRSPDYLKKRALEKWQNL